MMLDNSSYNKIKLLYKLSELLWFIDKHALNDAEISGDKELHKTLLDIKTDIQRQIAQLHKATCTITQ